MRIKSKISALAAGLSLCALMSAVPVAAVSAAPAISAASTEKTLTKDTRVQQPTAKVAETAGAAVTVTTELDCNMHQLTANVTNNTKGNITPKVTFNNMPPSYDYTPTIKPGNTAAYAYDYSGNYVYVDVKVMVDGQADTVLTPRLLCNEPVTFRVDNASIGAVTGYLQNNSTLLPQTVLTRVGSGDIRTEVLAPGESRLIALPFTGFPGQEYAFVTIAVVGGYESTYNVNLSQPPIPLPRPL